MGERSGQERARAYALKFFPNSSWPAMAGYLAGFNRGRKVERKDAWDKAAIFYANHPEKALERKLQIEGGKPNDTTRRSND